MTSTSRTSNGSSSGGTRTVARTGAPKSLGLQFRGERHWPPAQRRRDGYLDRLHFVGYERIAADECIATAQGSPSRVRLVDQSESWAATPDVEKSSQRDAAHTVDWRWSGRRDRSD
jgi:hypothetical protein